MAKKALIAMSGGVDSSVAAYLMLRAGYDCTGVTLRLFDNPQENPDEKACCSLDSTEDARSVCRRLGIPFFVYNFTEHFEDAVIRRFVGAYEAGSTPNPCIDCNRYIKFEKLLRRAEELGFDCVVTGHYATVAYDAASGRYLLKKSADTAKDQSYVLYPLTQTQLAKTVFPLGELTKEQTRAIAEEQGFVNARKHDSQDICFVPDGDYARFIEAYTGKAYPPGDFTDESGKVLGQHRGIIRYTVGQRKGLGLALPHPMYVKEKNLAENKVVLCDNAALFSRELLAGDLNLIAVSAIHEPVRVSARVRYNQKEQPATVYAVDSDTIRVVFDEPQRAISKGQAVVLYQGDVVFGGATIL